MSGREELLLQLEEVNNDIIHSVKKLKSLEHELWKLQRERVSLCRKRDKLISQLEEQGDHCD